MLGSKEESHDSIEQPSFKLFLEMALQSASSSTMRCRDVVPVELVDIGAQGAVATMLENWNASAKTRRAAELHGETMSMRERLAPASTRLSIEDDSLPPYAPRITFNLMAGFPSLLLSTHIRPILKMEPPVQGIE